MIVYIVIAVSALVAVLVIFALVMWLINNREERRLKHTPHYRHDVIVSGGVDITTGQMTRNDHRYFNGMKDDDVATIYLQSSQSGKLHPVGGTVSHSLLLVDQASGRQYGSNFKNEIVIGRAPKSGSVQALTVDCDNSISGNHCRIMENNGVFCIQDMGSSNHTYLNGGLLTSIEMLDNGDFVKMGKTTFQVFLN